MDNNKCLFNPGCGLNRREFLGGCATCAAGLAGISALGLSALGAKTAAAQEIGGFSEKAKVRLVFTHAPPEEATWPNIGYDYEGRKRDLTEKLRRACPEIKFFPVTAKNPQVAREILKGD